MLSVAFICAGAPLFDAIFSKYSYSESLWSIWSYYGWRLISSVRQSQISLPKARVFFLQTQTHLNFVEEVASDSLFKTVVWFWIRQRKTDSFVRKTFSHPLRFLLEEKVGPSSPDSLHSFPVLSGAYQILLWWGVEDNRAEVLPLSFCLTRAPVTQKKAEIGHLPFTRVSSKEKT
jgi:hypothetical protein